MTENLSAGEAATARLRAKALNGAGWISLFQGDYDGAKTLLESGLDLYRKLEDREGVASCLVNLGFVAVLGQRDDIPVQDLLDEATGLRPKLEDRRTIAQSLIFEGIVTMSWGDLEGAIELHEESLALLRRTNDSQTLGGCLANLGFLELARNDYARASVLFREDLQVAHGLEDKTIIQFALDGLAAVASGRGQYARATRLWGAAEAVREGFGLRISPLANALADYDNRLATARASLGDAAFEGAWKDGEAMPRDRAIEYALLEKPVPAEPPPPEELSGPRLEVLTWREEEIAALVAQGFTNRRIAEELSISERTVSTHAGSIFRKLGLRSRDEVASILKHPPNRSD